MKIDDFAPRLFSGLWDESFYGDSQNASRKNDLGKISKAIWSKR
jgi:hypothetical protein